MYVRGQFLTNSRAAPVWPRKNHEVWDAWTDWSVLRARIVKRSVSAGQQESGEGVQGNQA